MLKLYTYWRSTCAWRVRIALHHKKLPFDYVPVHLVQNGGEQNQPAYLAINPGHTVPALQVTGNDGQPVNLAQSLAILEYLEEAHPEPALLPRDPLARARVRQLAEQVNAGIQPLQNIAVTHFLKAEHGLAAEPWCQHWIGRGLAALEALAKGSAGRYLVGDAVSFADVCLVPQLYAARRFGAELTGYPTLLRVEETCAALPAFAAARAEAQPDAPATK